MRAANSVSSGSRSILVHGAEQVERAALLLGADAGGRPQVEDGVGALAEQRALVDGRQEAGAPAGRAALGRPLRLQHHAVGRQVVADAAQAVGHPGAEAGIAHQGPAAVQLVHGRGVDGAGAPAGSQKGDVVRRSRPGAASGRRLRGRTGRAS